MPRITTLFWDIGGVILTNGWDRNSRKAACDAFNLDYEEFQDRHDLSFPAFDAGQISLNEYLDRTLFYRPRKFSREEFTAFMFAQSKEYSGSRAILDAVVQTKKYFVGAINNEPLELNQYRIEAFNLRKSFQVFFSSCYVHSRKPEEGIFKIALAVTQRQPEECVFVDDRPLNLESPRRLGFSVIHYQSPEQLRTDLRNLQVEVEFLRPVPGLFCRSSSRRMHVCRVHLKQSKLRRRLRSLRHNSVRRVRRSRQA
jgi:putative hydrolase of the HAD superfamily